MPKIKNPDRKKYQYAKDPTSITQFLKTMLYMFLAVSVISLIANMIQVNLLKTLTFTEVEAAANDARQQLVFILYWIVFIPTGIAFLFWIYRANFNCHGFNAKGMKFSPGWSIGYFFIPILNFFEPYLAMKEVWQVSTDPAGWRQEKGSPLLGWWWTFWLISLFTFLISFLLPGDVTSIEALQNMTLLSIISAVVDILHSIAALLLVSTIFKKQEELVGRNA